MNKEEYQQSKNKLRELFKKMLEYKHVLYKNDNYNTLYAEVLDSYPYFFDQLIHLSAKIWDAEVNYEELINSMN